MDCKEKQEKKKIIGEAIDLANGKYKDDEVDSLLDLVEHRSKYDGITKTFKRSIDSWCSDGNFTRNEETTLTFRGDDTGIRIEEHYQFHDDDGQSGSSDKIHTTGRSILRLLSKVLG